jgi:hypothetical protein
MKRRGEICPGAVVAGRPATGGHSIGKAGELDAAGPRGGSIRAPAALFTRSARTSCVPVDRRTSAPRIVGSRSHDSAGFSEELNEIYRSDRSSQSRSASQTLVRPGRASRPMSAGRVGRSEHLREVSSRARSGRGWAHVWRQVAPGRPWQRRSHRDERELEVQRISLAARVIGPSIGGAAWCGGVYSYTWTSREDASSGVVRWWTR